MYLDWLNEEVPTKNEVLTELHKRKSEIKKLQENEKNQRKVEKAKKIEEEFGKNNRGEAVSSIDEFIKPTKKMVKYIKSASNLDSSSFFTTFPPDIIEQELASILTMLEIEPLISDKKYKMKFEYENVKMAFVIHTVSDEISFA